VRTWLIDYVMREGYEGQQDSLTLVDIYQNIRRRVTLQLFSYRCENLKYHIIEVHGSMPWPLSLLFPILSTVITAIQ
jgi:hypothetical protein